MQLTMRKDMRIANGAKRSRINLHLIEKAIVNSICSI